MTTVKRKLASLLALLVLGLCGLGLIVWQEQRSDEKAKAETAQKKVLSFTDASAIREVTLSTPAGTFTLVREGQADGTSRWRMSAPLATGADEVILNGLVETLVELSRTSVLGEQGEPVDRALLGLQPPRYSATLVDSQGVRETLEVGKKNSFNGALYVAKAGEPKVGLVEGSLEYQLDKDLFKLRDKRLVSFADADVARLALTHAGQPTLVVEKEGESWQLRAPIAALADSVDVSAMISALTGTTAKAFVSEKASRAELQAYGLAKPQARVEVTLKSGGSVTVLLSQVGKAGEAKYYAALEGDAPILELSSDWTLTKLRLGVDEVRDRHVLGFDRAQVGSLKVTKGDKTFSFVREVKDGGDEWRLTAPEQADAQDATLSGLLYRLWSLEAKTILAEKLSAADEKLRGLDAPELVIELGRADGTAIGTVRFGKREREGQYASAGQRLDVVEPSFVNETPGELADYKEPDKAAAK